MYRGLFEEYLCLNPSEYVIIDCRRHGECLYNHPHHYCYPDAAAAAVAGNVEGDR